MSQCKADLFNPTHYIWHHDTVAHTPEPKGKLQVCLPMLCPHDWWNGTGNNNNHWRQRGWMRPFTSSCLIVPRHLWRARMRTWLSKVRRVLARACASIQRRCPLSRRVFSRRQIDVEALAVRGRAVLNVFSAYKGGRCQHCILGTNLSFTAPSLTSQSPHHRLACPAP